jgi:hypothetical protein
LERFAGDVEALIRHFDIQNKGFCPGYLYSNVVVRSVILNKLGRVTKNINPSESKKVFQDCFEASTFALHLIVGLEMYHGEDNGTLWSKISMFDNRGDAAEELGMLDQALIDFKACRAKISLAGNVWKMQPTLTQVTMRILRIMAVTKVGHPRPHNTVGERNLLQKQLGSSFWSKDSHQCVHLKQCGKCHVIWYCSHACQMEGWKSGHKKECKVLS